jgi:hypothetical protein
MRTGTEDLLKEALQNLPDVVPPAGMRQRIEAASHEDAAGRVAAPSVAALSRRARWTYFSLAAAAAIAAIAIGGVARAPRVADPEPRELLAALPPYAELLEQSAYLERELASIRYQRPLMAATTASTIVALEDRIALVDEEIARGGTAEASQSQQMLWGARVDLLNALVQVRLEQAQPTVF